MKGTKRRGLLESDDEVCLCMLDPVIWNLIRSMSTAFLETASTYCNVSVNLIG